MTPCDTNNVGTRAGAPDALVLHAAWCFPATYLIHIAEEYAAGLYTWVARFGVEMSAVYFLAANGVMWVLMVGAVVFARRRNAAWVVIALGTIILINGTGHVLGTVLTRSYSPGAVSGLLLWMPLGFRTLVAARHAVARGVFLGGIAAGVLTHAMLPLVVLLGAAFR